MEGYGISNQTYGWVFAVITMGFVCLSQLNSFFSKYFRPAQIVFGAISVMVLMSIILLYGLNQKWFGIVGTAVMLFIFLGCVSIINPNAAALSMAPFEKNTSYAASLFGLIQWGIAGLTAIIVSLFKNSTAIPLAGIMAATATLALLITYVGSKAIQQQLVLYKTN